MTLLGGPFIKIARARAQLTQRELAERLDLPQSSVARWESGARQPTLDSFVDAVRACGLDLSVSLAAMDTSNDAFTWELLDEPPVDRVRRQSAAANGIAALRDPDLVPFDPLPITRALSRGDVRYVLVGRLAENLRGSPAVPLEREVVICPAEELENRVALEAVLQTLEAARLEDEPSLEPARDARPVPSAERWTVPDLGATVAVAPHPPGTAGYTDLARQATLEDLGPGRTVLVATLLDLIRIAGASADMGDRLGLIFLGRAYELSANYIPPERRPIVVPRGLEKLFEQHGITG